ncbi:hypothetical protein [Metaclostridioides mangenotii]|uniref:Uncharacterized protein n=1 Tax=Metaclostridioides mangenotii TaxID=1540 RepID=A0ABS4EE82_9FIRM|nr:hypothetical protein [Clostridioides mangenotii]MBP1856246.1 hypothetical protein [Clostridioides mangenotii]
MKNTDDIELFYESIKHKYPKLLEETRAHICPDENIIISSIESDNKDMLKTIYIDTLGSEELLTLAECDGSKSTLEIQKIIEERYGFSTNKFKTHIPLLKLYHNIFLDFYEEAVKFPDVVEITGTTEYFIPIYMVLELEGERIEKANSSKIVNVLETICDKGCRIIEVVGKNIITNKNINDVFRYMLDNFDLVVIRIDNFKADRFLLKNLEKYKDKVIWVVDKENNSEKLELKDHIRYTSLSKKGNSVRISSKGRILELDEINVKYVDDDFKDNRYKYDKIYIFADGRVEIRKIDEKSYELGNLSDLTIEEILLNRYIRSNIDEQIVKNL